MPRRAAGAALSRGSGRLTGLQSVGRALDVIGLLLRAPRGRQLADLSAELNLPSVTVHRVLQTLVMHGLVRKDPERGRYRMSSMFWLSLAAAFPDARAIQSDFRGILDELAKRTGAVAMLGIPHFGARRMTAGASASPGQGRALRTPEHAPMHSLAAGKCFLATLPDALLEVWLQEPLEQVTPHTITDPATLLREIQHVRAQGYATHWEECRLGQCGAAVPVLDPLGRMAGALQLTALVSQASAAERRQWVPLLQRAAAAIATALAAATPIGPE